MSDTNVLHVIMFAFGFPSMFLSKERELSTSNIEKISR